MFLITGQKLIEQHQGVKKKKGGRQTTTETELTPRSQVLGPGQELPLNLNKRSLKQESRRKHNLRYQSNYPEHTNILGTRGMTPVSLRVVCVQRSALQTPFSLTQRRNGDDAI